MKVIKFGSVAGNKIFPDKIREARISRGLSLAQLSELIGVSSQAISQYERGEIIPNPSILLKIVETLDFPINFFTSNNENYLSAIILSSVSSFVDTPIIILLYSSNPLK